MLSTLWAAALLSADVQPRGWLPSAAVTISQSVREPDPATAFQTGLTAFQANDYEAAIAAWESALSGFRAAENSTQTALTLNALAAATLSLSRHGDAIAYASESAAIAEMLERPDLVAQALGNLGIAYQASGQFAQAVETYEQALTQLQDQPESAAIAQLYGLLGNAYEALGDYDSAIAAQSTSMTLAANVNAPSLEATAQMNLGGLYSLEGDFDRAIAWYERGIALATDAGFLGSAAYGLNNLGGTYQKLGDQAAAIAQFQRSLALSVETGNRQLQATVLTNLGVAFEDANDFEQALRSHQASVAIARDLETPRLLADALNNLAHTQLVTGDFDPAEIALQESVQLLSALRRGLADADKVNVFDTQIYTYNLLMQVQVAQGDYIAALETSEAGRARAFVESFATDDTPITAPTIDELRQVAQRLDATLVEYAIVPEDDFTVQGRQRGEAGRVFVWVVAPDGTVTFEEISLAGITLSLNEQVQQSRSAIGALGRTRGIGVVQTDRAQSSSDLNDLYTRLIAPIEAALPDDPDALVVLVPHESLFYLPFAALTDAAGQALVDKHTLLTTPAIQLLDLTLAEATMVGAAPLVVGNPTMPAVPSLEGELQPLPGAEAEAIAIADLLQTQAILGSDATESQVATAMSTANVVHLATHGLLDYVDTTDRIPIPGAIALAPDDDDDGLLTAREIANLSLSAQLVVLSACDTGLGEVTGDGVVGLSRSLLSAGAQSTVVSLWAVPDEPTATLMQAFYTELSQGADKAQALRQAMLQTRAQYPDPINWAAFVLVGNPAPL
ncbi:CHAT domain-containing protein [Leptolyngbya iicbica]|uniref:CHAT domain-containing protein n=2 Tax=Cyanophyceae TaxID=3028117 RepID=A0A4Q7EHK1_9CYAN|nr:CHAT domain-containing tetratricopeptide repeat protein [Leptolyngbya sp. LK]RZM82813.1 CHAT domain-containing protein [Leptolyngbya sp. LK]